MPWVRIDDRALTHPKIAKLSDGAFRLWVAGLAYCQQHLTDGEIEKPILRTLPAMTRGRVSELLERGLWDVKESGVQVHDYLDWNDSKAHVLQAREFARERIARLRQRRNGEHNALPTRNETGTSLRGVVGNTTKASENGGESLREGPRYEPELDEISERAGRFTERFAELFREYRRGARYLSKPTIDFQEAKALCATWDDARLETLAIAFLTTNDTFCRNSAGTIPVFRSRASWCDDKLRQAGL